MQKSKRSVDYTLPIEICVMINVVFSSRSRASRLESDSMEMSRFRTEPNLNDTLETMLFDMATCTREKLLSILEATLSSMARYDEGNPMGVILSIAPKPKMLLNKMKNLMAEHPNPSPGNLRNSSSMALSSQRSLLSGVGMQNPDSEHLGQTYIRFLCNASEQLQTIVVDEEWVNKLFEVRYFHTVIAHILFPVSDLV